MGTQELFLFLAPLNKRQDSHLPLTAFKIWSLAELRGDGIRLHLHVTSWNNINRYRKKNNLEKKSSFFAPKTVEKIVKKGIFPRRTSLHLR